MFVKRSSARESPLVFRERNPGPIRNLSDSLPSVRFGTDSYELRLKGASSSTIVCDLPDYEVNSY